MSDRVTGYGFSIDEFERDNGDLISLERLVEIERDAYRGDGKTVAEMGDVKVSSDGIFVAGEFVAGYDDMACERLSSALRIPNAYMGRLDVAMQCLNINWWLDRLAEKEITLVVQGDALVDVCVGQRIEQLDVLEAALEQCPRYEVWNVFHQSNSTAFDLIVRDGMFFTQNEGWYCGVRVVHKAGMNAPDIAPIMLSESSCSIVEFSSPERQNIKGIPYADVIKLVSETIGLCESSIDGHFARYLDAANESVSGPRRRISLLSREHALPERIRAYALAAYDDSGIQSATYEDLVDLFASLAMKDEVKGASARRLQKLAGFVATKGNGERRCTSCDSVLVED